MQIFTGFAARDAGDWRMLWDGRDGLDLTVPCGVYFVRLDACGLSEVGKLIRVR